MKPSPGQPLHRFRKVGSFHKKTCLPYEIFTKTTTGETQKKIKMNNLLPELRKVQHHLMIAVCFLVPLLIIDLVVKEAQCPFPIGFFLI